jgi:hypothetical protein
MGQGTLAGVEVECEAPPEHPLDLWIEPWGDRLVIGAGERARLRFDGEVIESVVIKWMSKALWIGVPRYSTLTVESPAGETLGVYDTGDVPPMPGGLRPI